MMDDGIVESDITKILSTKSNRKLPVSYDDVQMARGILEGDSVNRSKIEPTFRRWMRRVEVADWKMEYVTDEYVPGWISADLFKDDNNDGLATLVEHNSDISEAFDEAISEYRREDEDIEQFERRRDRFLRNGNRYIKYLVKVSVENKFIDVANLLPRMAALEQALMDEKRIDFHPEFYSEKLDQILANTDNDWSDVLRQYINESAEFRSHASRNEADVWVEEEDWEKTDEGVRLAELLRTQSSLSVRERIEKAFTKVMEVSDWVRSEMIPEVVGRGRLAIDDFMKIHERYLDSVEGMSFANSMDSKLGSAAPGKIRRRDVYETSGSKQIVFGHPSAEGVPDLTVRLFEQINGFIEDELGREDMTKEKIQDFLLRCYTGFSLLHIPGDASGRTCEDMFLCAEAIVLDRLKDRPDLLFPMRYISDNGFRGGDGVMAMGEFENDFREKMMNEIAGLLGIEVDNELYGRDYLIAFNELLREKSNDEKVACQVLVNAITRKAIEEVGGDGYEFPHHRVIVGWRGELFAEVPRIIYKNRLPYKYKMRDHYNEEELRRKLESQIILRSIQTYLTK